MSTPAAITISPIYINMLLHFLDYFSINSPSYEFTSKMTR